MEVLTLKEDEESISEEKVKELSRDISEETGENSPLKIIGKLGDASGSVIVRKSDGSMQCDNTFEARMERLKDSLRTEIAKILFESE